jgi:hypothetical protein
LITKGRACNILSFGSCGGKICQSHKKMMKNLHQAKAKQDRTDVTTKIRCNLLVTLGRNNILRRFASSENN